MKTFNNEALIIDFQGQQKKITCDAINAFNFSGHFDSEKFVKISTQHFFTLMDAFNQMVGPASFDNAKQQLLDIISATRSQEDLEIELHRWLNYGELIKAVKRLETVEPETLKGYDTKE